MTVNDISDITSFRWATVTAVTPLTIKLDGDVAALPIVPDSLVDPLSLSVSDRVRVELSMRKVVVHGVANGGGKVEAGRITMTARAAAPGGWLLCQGQSLLRTDYPALFAAIGTTFGAADSTHFNVPNLKGRTVIGVDPAQTEFDVLGETGGGKTHNHLLNELNAGANMRLINSGSNTLVQAKVNGAALPSGGSYTTSHVSTGSTPGTTAVATSSTVGLQGATETGSSLDPYITLNHMIKI